MDNLIQLKLVIFRRNLQELSVLASMQLPRKLANIINMFEFFGLKFAYAFKK
jgi:hypothetical protein